MSYTSMYDKVEMKYVVREGCTRRYYIPPLLKVIDCGVRLMYVSIRVVKESKLGVSYEGYYRSHIGFSYLLANFLRHLGLTTLTERQTYVRTMAFHSVKPLEHPGMVYRLPV